MPRFEIHLLSGAVAALLFHTHPAASAALLVGSVFPDIDSRKSITHHSLVLFLGVVVLTMLYPRGLLVSLLSTVGVIALFELLLPRHRDWLHGLPGQLLFSAICYTFTFDLLVGVTAFLGTSLHRLFDGVMFPRKRR